MIMLSAEQIGYRLLLIQRSFLFLEEQLLLGFGCHRSSLLWLISSLVLFQSVLFVLAILVTLHEVS